MRVLDVILGVGVVGVAVLAARAIADATKEPTTATVALPPASAVAAAAAAAANPPAVIPAFQPVRDCGGADALTSDCWCWGEGRGSPECADFDYTVFFDGQSIQN